MEFREQFSQYNERRCRKQKYYGEASVYLSTSNKCHNVSLYVTQCHVLPDIYVDEVKSAERVQIDDIPLPELPQTAAIPYEIPLPQPRGILKKMAIPPPQE